MSGETDQSQLRRGDWVEVRSPEEILATLDEHGALDGLPFMPEMLAHCGSRFRITRRAEKTCVEVAPGDLPMRRFRNGGVVVLPELRCSGEHHGGCQRDCLFFWKEAWLKRCPTPVGPAETSARAAQGGDVVRARLRTDAGDGKYYCQSSELRSATEEMGLGSKLLVSLRDLRSGSRGPLETIWLYARPSWLKVLLLLGRTFPRGRQDKTPTEALGLQPGDWVEVKPVAEIIATLDAKGQNRGLQYDRLLSPYSGRRFRVRKRLDHMIVESNGKMRSLKNTVVLERTTCRCPYALGGCPREDPVYWREIWLRRVPAPRDGDAR